MSLHSRGRTARVVIRWRAHTSAEPHLYFSLAPHSRGLRRSFEVSSLYRCSPRLTAWLSSRRSFGTPGHLDGSTEPDLAARGRLDRRLRANRAATACTSLAVPARYGSSQGASLHLPATVSRNTPAVKTRNNMTPARRPGTNGDGFFLETDGGLPKDISGQPLIGGNAWTCWRFTPLPPSCLYVSQASGG